jgi:hypothetical protein
VEFVPRASLGAGYYEVAPGYSPSYYYYPTGPGYNWGYYGGYYGGGGGFFRGYYRVGNVIINGRRWGDIGYRYSHADLIRW